MWFSTAFFKINKIEFHIKFSCTIISILANTIQLCCDYEYDDDDLI